jgi:hypothetical protein
MNVDMLFILYQKVIKVTTNKIIYTIIFLILINNNYNYLCFPKQIILASTNP